MTDHSVMTDHPISPPPELVQQWRLEHCPALPSFGIESSKSYSYVATQAARWGADMELDACCEWADATGWEGAGNSLRLVRRPESPSLKEQALDSWDRLRNEAWCEEIDHDLDLVRRALEQLDD